MGFGIKELLVILVIVALLFGTKKLKNIGSDLGGAIKGFRTSVTDEDEAKAALGKEEETGEVIEGESEKVESEQDK